MRGDSMKKILFAVVVLVALVVVVRAQQAPILLKTPFETFDVSMDFVNRAQNGITIDGVTATRSSNGQDVTSSVIADTPAPFVETMTNRVAFRVKGGTLGETYIIAIRVTKTDTMEKLEGDISLRVVNVQ